MSVIEFKSAIDCRPLMQAKVGKEGIQKSGPSLMKKKKSGGANVGTHCYKPACLW
jgi:hypothetical protein